jgi:hypothetical protein
VGFLLHRLQHHRRQHLVPVQSLPGTLEGCFFHCGWREGAVAAVASLSSDELLAMFPASELHADDDDSWLDVNPEELERTLAERTMNAKSESESAVEGARLARQLRDFVAGASSADGVELPGDGATLSGDAGGGGGSQRSAAAEAAAARDQIAVSADRVLALLRGLSLNGKGSAAHGGGDGDDDDDDDDEPGAWWVRCASAPLVSRRSMRADEFYDMGDSSDDDGDDGETPAAATSRRSPTVSDLMRAMTDELATETAATSSAAAAAANAPPAAGAASGAKAPAASSAAKPGASASAPALAPGAGEPDAMLDTRDRVRVDKHVVSNLLQALDAENGMPGPASTLLSSLGIQLASHGVRKR